MATKGRKSASSEKTAGPSGVDLQAIEAELNGNAEAQAAFVKNPSKYLEEQGLKLRGKDKTHLKGLVTELTTGPKLAEGSDTGADFGISIRIRRWIRK